jgi:hypothetical protein
VVECQHRLSSESGCLISPERMGCSPDMNNKPKAEFEIIEAAESAERDGKRQVWDRMDGETSKAYLAFQRSP